METVFSEVVDESVVYHSLVYFSRFSIEISFFEEVFFLPFFASFRESDPYLEYIPLGVDTHWDKGSTGFFDFLSDSQYLLL